MAIVPDSLARLLPSSRVDRSLRLALTGFASGSGSDISTWAEGDSIGVSTGPSSGTSSAGGAAGVLDFGGRTSRARVAAGRELAGLLTGAWPRATVVLSAAFTADTERVKTRERVLAAAFEAVPVFFGTTDDVGGDELLLRRGGCEGRGPSPLRGEVPERRVPVLTGRD